VTREFSKGFSFDWVRIRSRSSSSGKQQEKQKQNLATTLSNVKKAGHLLETAIHSSDK
jgi:hypothetical protein